jgi:hypothetical protein
MSQTPNQDMRALQANRSPSLRSDERSLVLILDLPSDWQLPAPWQTKVNTFAFDRHDCFSFEPRRKIVYDAMVDVWDAEGIPYQNDPETMTIKRVVSEACQAIRLTPLELEALLAALTIELHVAYDARYRALTLVYPPDA